MYEYGDDHCHYSRFVVEYDWELLTELQTVAL